MYDPNTLAFEINVPFLKRKVKFKTPKGGERIEKFDITLMEVWHIDPETDGTDDSCDWYGTKLTKDERLYCKKHAYLYVPYVFSSDEVKNDPRFSQFNSFYTEEGNFGIWETVTLFKVIVEKCIEFLSPESSKGKKKRIIKKLQNDHFVDCVRSILWLMSPQVIDGTKSLRDYKDLIEGIFYYIFKEVKRALRSWYKHPKWHVHHWQIRISWLRTLREWLFSRCTICGRRFTLREASGCRISTRNLGPKEITQKFKGTAAHFKCEEKLKDRIHMTYDSLLRKIEW